MGEPTLEEAVMFVPHTNLRTGPGLFTLITFLVMPAWGQVKDMQVHGFVSQGYLDSSKHNYWADSQGGTFEFSEIGVNISKTLSNNLRFGIQLFAQDLGDIGNHEVEIDWALGDYHWRDELGFRVGKIKQPIGFYNQERDVDLLRSTIWVPQSVYPNGYRDTVLAYEGFSVYGNLPGDLEYELYTGTLNLKVDSPGIITLFVNRAGYQPYANPSIRNDYLWGGALRWKTPVEGLSLGGSFYENGLSGSFNLLDGTPIAFKQDSIGLTVLSLEYESSSYILKSEWSEYSSKDPSLSEPAGWYVQGAYRINDYVEINGSYDAFFGNKDDKSGATISASGVPAYLGWQKERSLGARFDLGPAFILKVEWHQIDGIGLIAAFDILNLDNLFEQDWHYLSAKATFHF